jgi:aromatic ring-opening dioxygenase catalytic subunit (LigB family)
MATIIGGIGCSHAPAMAGVYDSGKTQQAPWAPLFDAFARTQSWLAALRPDLAIVVYNDHLNHFFFDNYPTFALGIADSYPLADEGRQKRDFASVPGDSAFGWHIADRLLAAEFDPSICQELTVDHGVLAPLPLLLPYPWTVPILPLAVNVIRHPLPTPRRCYRLGQALRAAVESYPDARRVVVIATGGLSHHIHGPDFGYVNPAWDKEFLDALTETPDMLTALTIQDIAERAGAEGVEMIVWLTMRGALPPSVRCVERHYAAPALTGLAVLALEPTTATEG